ncbi:PFU-domain-containing protein [Ascobolus immersus RN42]|uniref:PFU-domain-containing protein n=1 Tax=Ascobolus immersus RN42 TaxID=1160509 RepID=A0A3N4IB77_ASCIM|nr:PFU-domain-containing protein [Ascobolus immersus RN42]
MTEEHPFKLSASLEGHSTDVRCVTFPTSDLIISCSRDATVRVWKREAGNKFDDHINHSATAYVNSVAWITPSEKYPNGLIASGSQDTLIDVREPFSGKMDADYLLLGHANNVCSLDYYDGVLVSGSWDGKARVWENWETQTVLEGHQGSVWGVLVLSKTMIVTAAADKTIRIWENGEVMKVIKDHTDVVRGLCRLPHGGFASCSNDGTVRTWTADGQPLQELYGHTAYVYSVSALPGGEIVSSGEDRTVRIWKGGECIQTITHPAISVWSVAACAENGDIVSGASDGVVRVFSRSPDRWADAETLKKYDDILAASAIPSAQVGEMPDKEQLPGPEALSIPGEKDGQVMMILNGDVVEARQWSSSSKTWINIGQVVDAEGTNKKQMYQGREYDVVFDVDIKEGEPPLKLPYNKSENPYSAAEAFLLRNGLDAEYKDTVAQFIIKNTKGTAIGPTTEETPDAWGTHKRYRPEGSSVGGVPGGVLPHKDYLTIASTNPADLAKARAKLGEFNSALIAEGQTEISLNADELRALDDLVTVLELCPREKPELGDPLVTNSIDVLIKILTAWPQPKRLPGLDLLRLLAAYSPDVAVVHPVHRKTILDLMEASGSFDAQYRNNLMLAVRVFVNMFNTDKGRRFVEDNSPKIYPLIHQAVGNSDNRPLKMAYVTLILNYAVLFFNKHDSQKALGLIEVISNILTKEQDSEVAYRGLVALGTALHAGGQMAKFVAMSVGAAEAVTVTATRFPETRITSIVAEMNHMLR